MFNESKNDEKAQEKSSDSGDEKSEAGEKTAERRITVNITMKRNHSNESYFIYVSTSFQFAALPHYQFKEKKANSKD